MSNKKIQTDLDLLGNNILGGNNISSTTFTENGILLSNKYASFFLIYASSFDDE